MKRFLAGVVVLALSGCSGVNVSVYGTKEKPQNISLIEVSIDDKNDNSDLKGNDFLKRDIISLICDELSKIKVQCLKDGDNTKPSHILIVRSQGVNTEIRQSGITSTPNYATGGTNVSGGGSYAVKKIAAASELVKLNGDKFEKIANGYARGSGNNYVRASFVPTFGDSPLQSKYSAIFTAAALSVFDY